MRHWESVATYHVAFLGALTHNSCNLCHVFGCQWPGTHTSRSPAAFQTLSFTQPRERHETYQDSKISYLAKGKSGDKEKGRGGKPNYKGDHKDDRDRVKGTRRKERSR